MCIDINIDKRLRFYGVVMVCQCLHKQINYTITGISETSIRQHRKQLGSSYLNCINVFFLCCTCPRKLGALKYQIAIKLRICK